MILFISQLCETPKHILNHILHFFKNKSQSVSLNSPIMILFISQLNDKYKSVVLDCQTEIRREKKLHFACISQFSEYFGSTFSELSSRKSNKTPPCMFVTLVSKHHLFFNPTKTLFHIQSSFILQNNIYVFFYIKMNKRS